MGQPPEPHEHPEHPEHPERHDSTERHEARERGPRPRAHGTAHSAQRALTLRIGHEELVIRRRYETASIVNDILIALWFTVGSVLFFSESLTTPGTWCFLFGSVELLIRPVIRLGRHLHLQRLRALRAGPGVESPQDY